jgi:hypothetical protein
MHPTENGWCGESTLTSCRKASRSERTRRAPASSELRLPQAIHSCYIRSSWRITSGRSGTLIRRSHSSFKERMNRSAIAVARRLT